MAVIKIKRPDVSSGIKTFLASEYASGTTLTVDSSTHFTNGNYICVGEPGLEKTEVTNLTATPPSDSTLTVTALKFSHPKGTPIYYLRWDQYYLQYRTTSTADWANYASMPTNLAFDAEYTEYTDTAATSAYQWRYRYYSQENTAYSDYSDIISASGWGKNTVGYMVKQIRKIVSDPEGKTVSDIEIIRFLNAAQDKIYALYDRWWFLLKEGTAIDSEEGTKAYSLPSDFGRMNRVQFGYVNGDTSIKYNLRYLTNTEFDYETRDQNASDNDEVKYYSIYPGDSDNTTGYLHVWPTPETDGLEIIPWYYKTMTSLDSFGDETDVSIPSILEDYALSQIFKIRGDEARATYYDKLFREQIELLKLMQKKQTSALKQLWRYQGRNADKRLYGTRTIYSDNIVENYW